MEDDDDDIIFISLHKKVIIPLLQEIQTQPQQHPPPKIQPQGGTIFHIMPRPQTLKCKTLLISADLRAK